jgi:hypothetical protein
VSKEKLGKKQLTPQQTLYYSLPEWQQNKKRTSKVKKASRFFVPPGTIIPVAD